MIFTSFSITPYSVNHMLEALNISKHILRRPNQIYSSSIYWYLNTLCGLNKLPIKYLSLQEAFFFRIKQHSQQKCNLQHKACRILYKTIVAFSYFTSILIHAIALQSPYFSQVSSCYINSLFVISSYYFYNPNQHSLPIYLSYFLLPYFYIKSSLQSPPKIPRHLNHLTN